jgi:hypothetical protein
VKNLVSFLVVFVVCALGGGCAAKDPDLPGATQAFQKRYPEYAIRSSRVESASESRKVVVVEFDAPNNAKNRGRAELLMEKATNSSWTIVSEKVNMWKR